MGGDDGKRMREEEGRRGRKEREKALEDKGLSYATWSVMMKGTYAIKKVTRAINAPMKRYVGPSSVPNDSTTDLRVNRPTPYSSTMMGMDQRKRNSIQAIMNARAPVCVCGGGGGGGKRRRERGEREEERERREVMYICVCMCWYVCSVIGCLHSSTPHIAPPHT